ncbi:MAG TPA: hypothetical protein VFT50_07340 [Baekduia sp.]|nr:hypothetical protein [Baekduia sp.]
MSRLPPPDPHESPGMEPPDEGGAPTEAVFFLNGTPSPADDRLSEAWSRLRPGVLFVVGA